MTYAHVFGPVIPVLRIFDVAAFHQLVDEEAG